MDEIWFAAGDRATDMTWYAKRASLGMVFSATELYMLTDTSPGWEDTWAFLDRRLQVRRLGGSGCWVEAAVERCGGACACECVLMFKLQNLILWFAGNKLSQGKNKQSHLGIR